MLIGYAAPQPGRRSGRAEGLRGADRADDVGCPAMHSERALRRRRREDEAPDQGGSAQRDLLGDEAPDGEPEHVHLPEPDGGD
jgi:hypothetical protein